MNLQRRRRDIGDVLTDFDDALRGTSEPPAQPLRFGWWLLAGTALPLAVPLPWLFRVMQRPAAIPRSRLCTPQFSFQTRWIFPSATIRQLSRRTAR